MPTIGTLLVRHEPRDREERGVNGFYEIMEVDASEFSPGSGCSKRIDRGSLDKGLTAALGKV